MMRIGIAADHEGFELKAQLTAAFKVAGYEGTDFGAQAMVAGDKGLLAAGIIPGIEVDTGAKDLAGHTGEKITEGPDGLRDRLAEYSQRPLGMGNGLWWGFGDPYRDSRYFWHRLYDVTKMRIFPLLIKRFPGPPSFPVRYAAP